MDSRQSEPEYLRSEVEEQPKRLKMNEEDRLSSLPDELLMHIIKFLDLKEAVKLSLYFEWAKVWTCFPDLHLYSSAFKKVSSFDEFVDRVLSLRDGSDCTIEDFYFSRGRRSEFKIVDKVTRFVGSHDVKRFELFSEMGGGYSFPPHLCSSDSLKSLKLRYTWSDSKLDYNVTLSHSLRLKELVSLCLESVDLNATEDFSGCPCLKILSLTDCLLEGDSTELSSHIVAPQLEELKISGCDQYRLILSTPKLRRFEIIILHCVPLIETDGFPLLKTLVVDAPFKVESRKCRLLVVEIIWMLQCFPNVEILELYGEVLELLSMFPDILEKEPLPFCKMRKLNIPESLLLPDLVKSYLLRNSPHAELLLGWDVEELGLDEFEEVKEEERRRKYMHP